MARAILYLDPYLQIGVTDRQDLAARLRLAGIEVVDRRGQHLRVDRLSPTALGGGWQLETQAGALTGDLRLKSPQAADGIGHYWGLSLPVAPTRSEVGHLAEGITKIILSHPELWASPRDLIEELVRRCHLLVVENDELREWVRLNLEDISTLRRKNSDLADQLVEANVRIRQLEGLSGGLNEEIRLPQGVSSSARGMVEASGQAAGFLKGVLASLVASGIWYGVQTTADPPPPSNEVIIEIGEINNYCQGIIQRLPEQPEGLDFIDDA